MEHACASGRNGLSCERWEHYGMITVLWSTIVNLAFHGYNHALFCKLIAPNTLFVIDNIGAEPSK